MQNKTIRTFFPFSLVCFFLVPSFGETLPSYNEINKPFGYDEMWEGFDPTLEPLDIEILKEWEQDNVVLKVLRYRIGIFNGQKSMMAAIYGHPKGKKNVAGLLQVHGGGQYAHSNAVLTNAKRGYATLSIAWAGRLSAPGYHVSPKEVKLFWEGKKNDPQYKITTDWGALDAYHAPSRYGKDAFPSIPVAEWTLDPVKSPRNNAWFLITLAGRRGLTFLEQQTEVDASRLGVYGHSMGGKLTVLIAGADKRVKAAAPSCGGISDRYSEDDLHLATVSDPPSLKKISCPIMFLSPSNDFHGRINDLKTAVNEINTKEWRVSCSPHHNHQDSAEFEVATQLWFDQHLQPKFKAPLTPEISLQLRMNQFPRVVVNPDSGREIEQVEIYFTQQGILQERGGQKDNSTNTKHRFWKFIRPEKKENRWVGDLPIFDTNRSLWVFGNVRYKLEEQITGAGYYYGTYRTDSFVLSSLLATVSAEELIKSGTITSDYADFLIEEFSGDWRNEWFTYNSRKWALRTNKLYEPTWSAPNSNARISIEIKSENTNKMAMWIDGYGSELNLLGNGVWQRFSLPLASFRNSVGESLASWSGIRELRLGDKEKLDLAKGSSGKPLQIGSDWVGAPPQFKNLRWMP